MTAASSRSKTRTRPAPSGWHRAVAVQDDAAGEPALRGAEAGYRRLHSFTGRSDVGGRSVSPTPCVLCVTVARARDADAARLSRAWLLVGVVGVGQGRPFPLPGTLLRIAHLGGPKVSLRVPRCFPPERDARRSRSATSKPPPRGRTAGRDSQTPGTARSPLESGPLLVSGEPRPAGYRMSREMGEARSSRLYCRDRASTATT
jgi:hypothetical protein